MTSPLSRTSSAKSCSANASSTAAATTPTWPTPIHVTPTTQETTDMTLFDKAIAAIGVLTLLIVWMGADSI